MDSITVNRHRLSPLRLECRKEHRDEIVQSKGEEFARMWELYLASCQATFYNGVIDVHQILVSKGVNNEIPMNRVI